MNGNDQIISSFVLFLDPNPDKPEQIATKAPRHKAKSSVNTHLCVFVSWWRKCFATKCKKIISKVLKAAIMIEYIISMGA
jgi:hypothetical protein